MRQNQGLIGTKAQTFKIHCISDWSRIYLQLMPRNNYELFDTSEPQARENKETFFVFLLDGDQKHLSYLAP